MPKSATKRTSSTGRTTIGIDLGGTKIQIAIVDATGAIVFNRRYATHADRGCSAIVAAIATNVRTCMRESRRTPQAIGIGVAGQIDAETGVVHFAPNLDWHEVALKAALEKELRLPVVVTNDVRAATWGEWLYGAGRGCADLVCLFVGTGIGGGAVSGGHMLVGANNTAGELGHMTIVARGRRCHCPNRGCLEAYASGWALTRRARLATLRNPKAGRKMLALAGSVENITPLTVAAALRQKDPLSGSLIAEAGLYLGAGLVAIINGLGPRLVILGGGMMTGFPGLLPAAAHYARLHSLHAAAEDVRIVGAKLGNDAGVVGVASMARTLLERG